ncbi:vesicle-associated membrane protein/synaptobrevin-binding protein-like isoform X2 [Varroa jacobsoni]|uniref:MSP domain-containing protein n=1 Tax=Varroa destructor TaxID=109461 RepID=A0A7M7KNH4_VARDE|nr:vesicle-associated membrane protein/synaptobrevin-binding protein-like [Varroa destructor]XP_022668377.1 vesicle-associated membrane protein/synaptobrevin-binding protein-like [Varroa destructor]XP_022668378.1 vesicle-associated membrane protein/synaptobrevin-binding protein-like [Varroa destructor]XP_022668379.1 vesicle-associated membrane protein/synaptobrevin-binding protein-like [Varroa destructor]XP_022668380.1 vesicle-associated membrane protein/synaptobrevin-binding protein-like [Varr
MAAMEQILLLEPKTELRFKGPFTEVSTALLHLSNPSEKRVCFKVKTTAPKRYCVRPNCGVIDPKQTVTVQVMLQPFEYDPNERNKHKFMVQSMIAPEGPINHDIIWKDAPKEQLMDSKLRCVFELPGDEDEAMASSQVTTTVASQDPAQDVFSASLQNQEPAVEPSPQRFITLESGNVPGADTVKGVPWDELKKLQDENIQLRKENASLKEEGLRQRVKSSQVSEPFMSKVPSGAGAGVSQSTSFGPLSQVSHNTLLVYAVMLIVCGFILGKFIF